ncbi:hypothetical protein EYC80_010355 [Monilinia laxa]|uniref:Tyrosyl-DNA phosphodiesterase n=1 Tax=Monilinia laxa TaxID=61186 RepID=A0A5N6JQ49_MONLA|nr:hypothetical protein EYC80_010355 [Monilinia laxa]
MDQDQDHSKESDEPIQKRRKLDDNTNDTTNDNSLRRENLKQRVVESPKQKVVKSPFQLTSIRDLPASSNLDTVSLKDILGDPLISECWEFNYLHNLDFLMEQFDEDIRNLVKVNVIHGFWKREDPSRLYLMERALKYPNINLLTAYMPEMFGTHHSKMFILFRHDSTAQVIIHTANMIPFDWTNMTQAVWKSPLLPLLDTEKPNLTDSTEMGSGGKFKLDLLNYLRAYDTKRIICKPLIEQLSKHDFSEIRASLVWQVFQESKASSLTHQKQHGAGQVLQKYSSPYLAVEPNQKIAVQISSIASLGPTDKWLNQTLFKALGTSKSPTSKPKFKIIFPTADEVRRSLNGYASGNAIHTKILTPAQGKQLSYLKPMLCHWAGDGPQHQTSSPQPPEATSSFNSNTNSQPQQSNQNAHRKRAAPHIKTYMRFSSSSLKSIDWMLVTSANLSKQAWGENTNAAGEVRICSYEIGVLVWPSLWGEEASMVPCFGTDTPLAALDLQTDCEVKETNDNGKRVKENEGSTTQDEGVLIGVRMPYDLPIIPYAKNDTPWCATASYTEPDWMGQTWNT